MAQHLNFSQKKTKNYSLKHSFGLVFNKIETVFFCLICMIFLITSHVNPNFQKNVSFAFVNVSLPVVKLVAFPFNALINLVTDFHELVDAKKENKELKEELNKLKNFYIKSLNIYQENKELRNILNFVSSKTSSFKVAKITGRSNQLFNQKLFIDAGENREIKEGSVVAGEQGVIGRIVEVSQDKSRLILLTDASSRVPIITSKSRIRGILAGNGSNLMEILYLPKNHNVIQGDWIFTSGDGDTIPPALLIGMVKRVTKDSAEVEMIENVNNAEIVTILGN
jgi:rod shape-determining protein MreC